MMYTLLALENIQCILEEFQYEKVKILNIFCAFMDKPLAV